MTTTRYPENITTAVQASNLGEFILPDRTKTHAYWEDFDSFVATDWTIVPIGTGSVGLNDGDGAILSLSTGAAFPSALLLMQKGKSWLFETTKRLWFKTRFKVLGVGTSGVEIGLGASGTQNGIYFRYPGGSTLELVVEKAGVVAAVNVSTIQDDTYLEAGWSYDGKKKLLFTSTIWSWSLSLWMGISP